MMVSDDIFIGPVLRRAETDLVVVCLATFQPFALKFSIRAFGTEIWLGHDPEPVSVKASSNLYFYFGIVAPMKGTKFPTNTLLEYSIGVIDPVTEEVEYNSFKNIVLVDKLSYFGNELPTLFLQEPGKKLNALYGSCRKIHDEKGGKTDALSFGDGVVENYFSDLTTRPAVLCLGGDQIYADDVHKIALEEIIILGKKISGGKTETLPASMTLPPVGGRTDFITKNAKFTSGETANHLVSFAEYLAMYGLMWNKNNWSQDYPELTHFTDSLLKVRRLMANTPTYMIFDDHDVTDDWNLSVKWKEDVKAFKLGKRIVANAVGAYWLCQGFGNNPVRYPKDLTFQIADIITQREKDYDAFENFFWALDGWEFFTPTYPFIYFLDTRTQRGLKDGHLGHDRGAAAYLKSLASWAITIKTLTQLLQRQQRDLPLIMVAAAPVFGFKFVEDLQALVGAVAGPYFLDLESWAANRRHLLLFLYLMGNANVVLLSGDVHYSFTSTVKFSVFDDKTLREAIRQFPRDVSPPVTPQGGSATYDFLWGAKFIQLTSSALKNFASDTAVRLPANLTLMEPALFIREDGGMAKGKYENGDVFEWVVPPDDKPGKFIKQKKEDLKPATLFRQRVNDAFNSQYISEHNIGLMTVNSPEISNCFWTAKGKTAERSWNFSNDKYWE
jgi:hypothetical protein